MTAVIFLIMLNYTGFIAQIFKIINFIVLADFIAIILVIDLVSHLTVLFPRITFFPVNFSCPTIAYCLASSYYPFVLAS